MDNAVRLLTGGRYHRVIMNTKLYLKVSGVIFAALAVLHALRLYYKWPAMIGDYDVPVWWSWVAVAVSGYLAFRAYKFLKK